MRTLKDKTLFITGASRGIGEAIALRAAADGANVVIAAKTTHRHPKLPGTIHIAAEAVEKAGGQALAVTMDVREEESVTDAVRLAVERFGGIDILVNNASAIWLAGTLETPMKRYDLMNTVNTRGTFLCSQKALPQLLKAPNPHILNLAPPLNLDPKWFRHHTAYTLSKYGMSFCTLGLAAEFAGQGVGVNALWPRTVIATAAISMLGGRVQKEHCRLPAIVADAAHAILTRPARTCSGNFFIDEEVLHAEGVSDFTRYAVMPDRPLVPDLFLD
jgi:citronellol/citronellal dehydrogenase